MSEEEIREAEKSSHHLATSDAAGNGSSVGFLLLCDKALEQAVPTTVDPVDCDETGLELPSHLMFNDDNLISVIVFSILMVVSVVGNVTVLVKVLRLRCNKGQRSRINLLLLHLFIADLLVAFLMMPLEIAWSSTVSWNSSDLLCRIMSVFRVFGLYLSGFIVTSIGVDCFFAFLKPFHMHRADVRGRILLIVSWAGSVLCSIPQAFVFHVEPHPRIHWFHQCVTFDSFPTHELSTLYAIFGSTSLHSFPSLVLVSCYLCVLHKVCAANKQSITGHLRRSSTIMLSRAKMNTLKMTITILSFSCLLWLPYNVVILWDLIDFQSAQIFDERIRGILFIIACTSTCLNPLVYGYFHLRKPPEVLPLRPHPFRPQEQAQGCRVRWGVPKGSRGGNSAAARGIFDERIRPAPAQSTELKTVTFNRPGEQLESSQGEPAVSIIFDPQAACQAFGAVKFTIQSREIYV